MRVSPVALLFMLCATTIESFVITPSLVSQRSGVPSKSFKALPYESFDSVQQSAIHLWDSYATLLKEKPLETKSITAAILACTGDAVAQILAGRQTRANDEEATFSYDPRRGLAFMGFGALYTGLFQHYWFGFLDQHILDWGESLRVWGHAAETNIAVSYFVEQDEWWKYFDLASQIENIMATLQDPPTTEILAAAKVAVNQFLVIPFVYMPLFFAITGALGGLDIPKSIARARSLYMPILQRNYLYWLPVQFGQFLFVPMDYQITYVCVASLIWTIILSSIGGTPSTSPSTIVAYETDSEDGVSTVMPVDAGTVNAIMDSVNLEDVQNALVPPQVSNAMNTVGETIGELPNKVGTSASGLTIGLMASAADQAAIPGMLGVKAQVGVAVATAVGAGIGYLAGASEDDAQEGESKLNDSVEIATIDDDDGLSAIQLTNSTNSAAEAFAGSY